MMMALRQFPPPEYIPLPSSPRGRSWRARVLASPNVFHARPSIPSSLRTASHPALRMLISKKPSLNTRA